MNKTFDSDEFCTTKEIHLVAPMINVKKILFVCFLTKICFEKVFVDPLLERRSPRFSSFSIGEIV